MKSWMNSELISVLAETASRVLPDGAVTAATDMDSLTVMEVATDSTDMVMGTSRLRRR